ncbi:MAG TPA: mannose-1-phosphate guanylyltransferase [Salinimicrobium sp.]|nr:mannose-1-phosphate guanylyltransferase [Salinimicrobium sp.]
MTKMNQNNFAILMAGGVGSRFWPVSTAKKPKQFLDLLGTGESLLQTTFKRLSKLVPQENIYVLTNSGYESLVKGQLPEIKEEQLVLETAMRNTAPAVLLATLKIHKKNQNAVMLMAPSDHWIEDESAFKKNIEDAFEACAAKGKIVTLGVKPSFPNTGYGYIKFSQGPENIKKVENFTEKPTFEVARQFFQSGNYVWNSGIFIWNAEFLLNSFRKNLPEMHQLFSSELEVLNTSEEKEFIASHYSQAENISIDYGILERETEVYMIAAAFDWNDLGTWGSLYEESEKDENENAVLNARIWAKNATGNIISSNSNKVVVLEDVNNYMVIDEKELLMIVPKGKEQEIKQIRDEVQQKFGEELG